MIKAHRNKLIKSQNCNYELCILTMTQQILIQTQKPNFKIK